MYSEVRQSGGKQFFFALIIMMVMYAAGSVINYAFSGRPLVRFAVLLGMCCVAVYIVYRRYGAKYTYILDEKAVSAETVIGHKSSVQRIEYKKIDRIVIGSRKYLPRNKKYCCVSILPNKNFCYIVYEKGTKALVIEPGAEFQAKLKEHIK